MAVINITFHSNCLRKQTDVSVLIPDRFRSRDSLSKRHRTLWLLHGMTGDNSSWMRHTDIESLSDRHELAVVMPNADLSFYANMVYGGDYFDFVTEELPAFLRCLLPLSPAKEHNYVAGNSMGGYGAFRIALSRPHSYEAAVSFSGPMDISSVVTVLADERIPYRGASWEQHRGEFEQVAAEIRKSAGVEPDVFEALVRQSDQRDSKLFKAIYGAHPCLKGNDHDLFFLAGKLKQGSPPLRLYALCGVSDFHHRSNLVFRKYASELGIDYFFEDGTGGHDWDYWNERLPKAVAWMLNDNEGRRRS